MWPPPDNYSLQHVEEENGVEVSTSVNYLADHDTITFCRDEKILFKRNSGHRISSTRTVTLKPRGVVEITIIPYQMTTDEHGKPKPDTRRILRGRSDGHSDIAQPLRQCFDEVRDGDFLTTPMVREINRLIDEAVREIKVNEGVATKLGLPRGH